MVARAEVRVQEALEQAQMAEQRAIVAEKENVAHSKPSGMNEQKSTYIEVWERLVTEQKCTLYLIPIVPLMYFKHIRK